MPYCSGCLVTGPAPTRADFIIAGADSTEGARDPYLVAHVKSVARVMAICDGCTAEVACIKVACGLGTESARCWEVRA
jgi:hypothetical protein